MASEISNAVSKLVPKRVCIWVREAEDTPYHCTEQRTHHCLIYTGALPAALDRIAVSADSWRARAEFTCRFCDLIFITGNFGPERFDRTVPFFPGGKPIGQQLTAPLDLCGTTREEHNPELVVVPSSRRVELMAWLAGYRAGKRGLTIASAGDAVANE